MIINDVMMCAFLDDYNKSERLNVLSGMDKKELEFFFYELEKYRTGSLLLIEKDLSDSNRMMVMEIIFNKQII